MRTWSARPRLPPLWFVIERVRLSPGARGSREQRRPGKFLARLTRCTDCLNSFSAIPGILLLVSVVLWLLSSCEQGINYHSSWQEEEEEEVEEKADSLPGWP